MKNTEYYKHQARFSKAAELYVRAKLLLLGFYPASFDTDDGCDIILDNGIRVQVKSALSRLQGKRFVWAFSLKSGHEGRPLDLNKFDYLICVGFIKTNTFEDSQTFIIPRSKLACRATLSIPVDFNDSQYKVYADYFLSPHTLGGDTS